MVGKLKLELTLDEAIVLFDWIGRFNQGSRSESIEHESEQTVLWSIESMLESSLEVPFSLNYKELVAEARDRLLSRS
ncbi:MAG: hypothetical protein EOP04_09720 [Proteobacteria bacterium]|nr:MAG: hypothetical protein EOP04_09720 [Pseudomonadota bacterium]